MAGERQVATQELPGKFKADSPGCTSEKPCNWHDFDKIKMKDTGCKGEAEIRNDQEIRESWCAMYALES